MKTEKGEVVGNPENNSFDKTNEEKDNSQKNLFVVTKVWENAPRGYADSDTERAELIRSLIRIESKKLLVQSIIPSKDVDN